MSWICGIMYENGTFSGDLLRLYVGVAVTMATLVAVLSVVCFGMPVCRAVLKWLKPKGR